MSSSNCGIFGQTSITWTVGTVVQAANNGSIIVGQLNRFTVFLLTDSVDRRLQSLLRLAGFPQFLVLFRQGR
jgi:hypothetical protein